MLHSAAPRLAFLLSPRPGNGERARDQRVELRMDGPNGARGRVRFFHLSEYLRLAHDERIGGRVKVRLDGP